MLEGGGTGYPVARGRCENACSATWGLDVKSAEGMGCRGGGMAGKTAMYGNAAMARESGMAADSLCLPGHHSQRQQDREQHRAVHTRILRRLALPWGLQAGTGLRFEWMA